jgi:hypothetical protein
MKLQRRTLLLVCLICGAMLFPIPLSNGLDFIATPAWAHDMTPHPHAEDSKVGETKDMHPKHGSMGAIGSKLANPVSDLWQLAFSLNAPAFYDGDINSGDPEVGGVLAFQPVMPIPLWGEGEDEIRMIVRPIIPIIFSEPIPKGNNDFTHQGGIGDIQLPMLINVPKSKAGNWLLGTGPVALFPTATTDALGSDQFAMGPAVVLGYAGKKNTFGIFPNYFWKVGSTGQDGDTANINQGSLLYFFNYMLPNAWQVGMNPTIKYNKQATSGNKWTVPVGGYVGKTTKIGRLPVNIKFGLEYSVVSPDDWGQRVAFRLQVTPVVPGLIKKAIFGK